MSAHPLQLSPHPPGATAALSDAEARLPDDVDLDKKALDRELDQLTERLDELQRRLHAEGARALLVVLQGRDASGKDGTIRKVFGPLDPQGVVVTSFKAPTEEELRHDFLWRVHRAVPGRGAIGVFNRSHYEDVLVVRVRGLAPESVWRPRYEQINLFERILVENGVDHPQVLPSHLARGAAGAPAGPPERPREVLEVQRGRPGGAGAVGRSTPRRMEEVLGANQHGGGTLVRGAGGQETGPGPAGGPDGRGRRWSGWTRDGRDRRRSSRRSGRRCGVEAQILPSGTDDDEGERVAQHEERALGRPGCPAAPSCSRALVDW